MKNVKTSLLALTVGLCSVIAAVGGKATKTPPPPLNGTNYTLNATITNVPPPVVIQITGTPVFGTFGSNSPYGLVYTDGSGKLDGVEDMIFTNLSLCSLYTSGDFITEIGGSIKTMGGKGKNSASSVVVGMTMKGNGYVQNSLGSTQSAASLSLTFTGTLFPSNSLVNLTTTNTFLEIGTNFGEAFTNIYTYAPVTNVLYTNTASYQEVTVTYYYEESFTSTNTGATNTVTQQDYVCYSDCPVRVGTPTGTTNLSGIANCTCTNSFTNVVIGTNITFRMTGTNVTQASTNYVYGIDTASLSAYLAAVSNCITTNGTGYVQVITSVTTNTVVGVSGSSTNTTLYAQLFPSFYNGTNWIFETNTMNLSFSNGFYEVDGTLKGTIKAGKCSQKYDGSNASFSLPFTDYTTMIGSGSNTNGPYFGTNEPYLSTNDSGVFYVVYEAVPNSDLAVGSAFGQFRAKIKQVGTAIYASSQVGLIGAGSMNTKKGTYSVKLAGLGRLSGSSLVITGATGVDIVGYTVETNIVAITNLAANPPVVGFVTNIYSYPTSSGFFSSVTNGIGTTNVTITDITICEGLPVPPLVATNTVNCIKTIFGNGTVLGQKVSGSGTNVDIAYPNPALP